jgi:ATP phosphoribosyltransferase regulatory subunit
LHGDRSTIARARAVLPVVPAVSRALDDLAQLAEAVRADEVSIDLSDLHGYRYHTGITFAAFLPRLPSPALRGGRYDDIGAAFGRARPATGFSILDLRELVRVAPTEPPRLAIRAPRVRDPALEPLIARLRASGEVVIRGEGHDLTGWQVERECRLVGGRWQVVPLPGA